MTKEESKQMEATIEGLKLLRKRMQLYLKLNAYVTVNVTAVNTGITEIGVHPDSYVAHADLGGRHIKLDLNFPNIHSRKGAEIELLKEYKSAGIF